MMHASNDGTIAAITAKHIQRSYPVRGDGWPFKRHVFQAIADVSLDVRRGEIMALVGESGCGKSTLARIMFGQDRPTGGQLRLFGEDPASMGRLALARLVQPVFQDPNASLNPSQTIGAAITTPLDVHRIGEPGTRRAKAEAMMERVGLRPAFYHHYPRQLSGGQRQRVAIARALILSPRILICDEPTSALDVSVQAQILNLLQQLHRELDLTIVLISHNLSVVRHLAQRVAVMHRGEIVEQASSATLFAQPQHAYTRTLLDADPNLNPAMSF